MGLAGRGAVAIWHDIAPEGRAQFYAWHGRQHMPERAAIPGFLRGRRYVSVHGVPEFFNLYEVDSPAVLSGAAYLERLNHPTPWTVASVAHFRGVARSLCDVVASLGEGDGGLVATLRYDVDDAGRDAHRARMTGEALPAMAASAGIAGAHLLVADTAASGIVTAEQKARKERNLIPAWIAMIEGWADLDPFVEDVRRFAASGVFADNGIDPDWAVYRLQNERRTPLWSMDVA